MIKLNGEKMICFGRFCWYDSLLLTRFICVCVGVCVCVVGG